MEALRNLLQNILETFWINMLKNERILERIKGTKFPF